MSRDASLTLDFGDGEHRFRLGYRELIELQEKCDAGPTWIRQAAEGRESIIGATKSAAILEKLNAIEPFGGAASIEAGISGNQFWVAAVHPYAGKSGKQITKALERFIEDDSDGFFKRVKKTVEAGL